MKTHHIARRTFLRGVGTTMALPFLESLVPRSLRAATAAAAPPVRMAWVYIPQGAYMPYWMPKAEKTTADYELSECLQPMAEHKKDIMILGGLACDKARANGDGGGDHARAGGAFLTGAQPKKTAGLNIQAGVSADQFAAMHVGQKTRFPSLEMAIEGYRGSGNCDSGYACVYEHTLSWRNATTPLPNEVNPKLIFDRLFAEKPNDSESIARNQLRASVLDSVLADTRELNRKLGGNDRQKLDQYLTSVRELEQQIQRAETLSPLTLPDDVSRPAGVPADLTEHIRLMSDLMVLAFQTDVTRISTFMLGREGSEQKYRMVGVTEGHHTISHHQNKPENLARLKLISIYQAQQFAYLVKKLKSVKEGNGTLLDNCMICFGSAIADPNRHAHEELPILLAGRGGGSINPGRFVRYAENTPLNNLWMSMLERFGTPAERIGDSTGTLGQLT
ncbi:MAG TPA: DUF1552 domain-containing protein [Opitutaceae bacterium]|nr:DUF1552 domain-containing protein [Opitutaceae bacterium]